MNRINRIFKRLQTEGKKAFIPYIMAGDPSLEKTIERVLLLEKCGADIIELGVPFTDPLADGPTIQRAAERALSRGVTLKKVIGLVKDIRQRSEIPLILMTYYNPVFKYREEQFVNDAVSAGADGVIIPDLPPDEAGEILRYSKKAGLCIIFLLAPTSTPERIKKVAKASTGFIYYVPMTGITGSEIRHYSPISDAIKCIRDVSPKPVCIGFGVSGPDDARKLSGLADGVIVGSAIIRHFHEQAEDAERFIKSLREAI